MNILIGGSAPLWASLAFGEPRMWVWMGWGGGSRLLGCTAKWSKLWLGSLTFLQNIKSQKRWKVTFPLCPTNRRKGEKNSPGIAQLSKLKIKSWFFFFFFGFEFKMSPGPDSQGNRLQGGRLRFRKFKWECFQEPLRGVKVAGLGKREKLDLGCRWESPQPRIQSWDGQKEWDC